MTAPVTDLLWRGTETIAAARCALERRDAVQLHLPASLHHTVVARLRPAPPSAAGGIETLELTGGAELITRLAAIEGLEALAPLAARSRAQVRVASPSPTLVIEPPGAA